MDKRYFIIVDMKSLDGYIEFAKFFLGDDQEFSRAVFGGLQFVGDTDAAIALRMELLESSNGVDEVLQTIYCTLKQLKENCEFITKEVFRHFIF